jgi:hypothetical protein
LFDRTEPTKIPTAAPPTSQPLAANEVFARFASASSQARYHFQHQQPAQLRPTNTPETPASPAKADNHTPAAKPETRGAGESKPSKIADSRAERLERLQKMFERKAENGPEDGNDNSHGPGRGGGGRGGRTR